MEKPEYIKNVEKNIGEILSKTSLGQIELKSDTFDKKTYVLLYIDMIFREGESIWKEKVIKTTHGFFICLVKLKNESNSNTVNIDIYHNSEQLNELTLFIRQFIKQNKI